MATKELGIPKRENMELGGLSNAHLLKVKKNTKEGAQGVAVPLKNKKTDKK